MNDCISEYVMADGVFVPSSHVQFITDSEAITIFEVVRIIDGVILFLEDHLQRLINSAQILGVVLNESIDEIAKRTQAFVAHEQIVIGNIKLIFEFKDNISSSIIYQLRHSYPTQQMYKMGVKTAIIAVERSNPNAKNVQPFKQIAEQYITEKNIYEVILIDKNGNITEGSKSNIFFIKNDEITTPPAQVVLLGITRKYVIELANRLKLNVIERNISQTELINFDSAFISGTSPKILPVRNISAITFNPQNQVLKKLITEYDNIILHYINTRK